LLSNCRGKVSIAASFAVSSSSYVTGSVRNLPDGRVELNVMSHDADELDAFLAEIEEHSELANHIREKESHPIAPLTGVTGFSIA
jgi:acylphosphatase